MGTHRSRRRKGGVAIASGSDGCVFDTRFLEDGTPQDAPGVVSKVFPANKKDVAQNEFTMNGIVKVATKGVGVLVNEGGVRTISGMNDTIPAPLVESKTNACAEIVKQKDSGVSTPFYVLESPRVKGTLLDFKRHRISIRGEQGDILPLSVFQDAITAVGAMGKQGIAQMDIANRNIFVSNDDKALIADFGSALNMNDMDFKSRIEWYVTKYGITNVFSCLYDFGSSANVRTAMMMYTTDDIDTAKEAIQEQLQTDRKGNYFFMDCYRKEIEHAPEEWKPTLIKEMGEFLTKMLSLADKAAILNVLKEELCRSDSRVLAMLILKWCGTSEAVVIQAKEMWYSNNAPRGGRKTRRNRGKRVKMSRRR